MRTNIEIDDKLMKQAMKASGLETKKATVEEALRLLVRLRAQGRIRELFGKFPSWGEKHPTGGEKDKWAEAERRWEEDERAKHAKAQGAKGTAKRKAA